MKNTERTIQPIFPCFIFLIAYLLPSELLFPFATIIQYELKTPQPVKLVLYDLLGRQIEILEQGMRAAAVHRLYFDAAKLANGHYFYQLQTPSGIRTKQLTIIK